MRRTQQAPVDAGAVTRRRRVRRPVVVAVAAAAAAAVVVTLMVFEPQALIIDERVDEAAPTAPGVAQDLPAQDAPAGGDGEAEPQEAAQPGEPEPAPPAEPAGPAGPAVLGQGSIRGLDHRAEGTALLLDLGNGERVLRFENLNAENGPDLWVYLSAAPADGPASAHTDDFVSLGRLKGNQGNQNYEIPGDVDVTRYQSAVIWCRRFSVGFAAAPLA